MPVHRVKHATDIPARDLEEAIKRIERAGENIVQVISEPREWIIVTTAPPTQAWTSGFGLGRGARGVRASVEVVLAGESPRTLVPRDANPAYHRLAILDRYEVDVDSGCWVWVGNITNCGYGRCKVGNKVVAAHRVMYEHHVGPIPAGLDLDHLCRNRACVNPKHLEPVTRAENTRRGAAAKLTREAALEIRAVMDGLCEKYGVKPRTLAAIGERAIWKDAER